MYNIKLIVHGPRDVLEQFMEAVRGKQSSLQIGNLLEDTPDAAHVSMGSHRRAEYIFHSDVRPVKAWARRIVRTLPGLAIRLKYRRDDEDAQEADFG